MAQSVSHVDCQPLITRVRLINIHRAHFYIPILIHINVNRLSSVMAQDHGESHLSITIEPSASAFFAGELFQARITLTNTRWPVGRRGIGSGDGSPRVWSRGHHAGASVDRGSFVPIPKPQSTDPFISPDVLEGGIGRSRPLKGRLKQIGPGIPVTTRTPEANGGENGEHNTASGLSAGFLGSQRNGKILKQATRARSVDLQDGTMSTQEMVWSLTQQNGECLLTITSAC